MLLVAQRFGLLRVSKIFQTAERATFEIQTSTTMRTMILAHTTPIIHQMFHGEGEIGRTETANKH